MDTPRSSHHALVIGGSSGLGLACARALHEVGSSVTITSRERRRATDAAAAIGPGALGMALDMTDPAAVTRFTNSMAQERIDQLVLNSGGPRPGRAKDLSTEDALQAMQSLLFSQMELVRMVLPSMTGSGWGRIVAIGSSGVQQPIPALAASNIGRAALAAYLKSLAADVMSAGVTVNMALPGRVSTDRIAALDQAESQRSGVPLEEIQRDSVSRIPAGRYGRPEEFGTTVAFLCSESASYITGEQIRVDGGMVGSF